MRSLIFYTVIFSFLLTACKKDDPELSGIVTINNTLNQDKGTGAYYVLGFSFSKAGKSSSLSEPPPDLTVDVYNSIPNLMLEANSLLPSFFLAGEYAGATEALTAFNSLETVSVPAWEDWAVNIRPHQVWIFRDRNENYAKLRIISVLCEARPGSSYAECRFEWVYQPDGSATFPVR
jgi:hypothetical protein